MTALVAGRTRLDVLSALTLDDGRRLGEALEPWQREHVIDPIYAEDVDGQPRHRLCDFELHRGAGKTTLVAAIALIELLFLNYGHIYAFACDEDQARLLHEAAAGFIRRGGATFQQQFEVERRMIRSRRTHSELRIMSADAASAYGLIGDLFIVDEIAQLRDRALWDAVYTAMAKRRSARIVMISTPGWSHSSIAWEVREAARTSPGYYLYAPGERVATWLDAAELERQRAALPAHVFRRQHLGLWSEGEGALITAEDLARCLRPERQWRASCTDPAVHVLALDLGLTNDRTGLAVVHRTPQGVALDCLDTWQGSRAAPVSITAEVEPKIRQYVDAFPHARVVLDPWQSQSTSERLRALVRVDPFEFSGPNIDRMTRNLYSLAHNGQLELYADPDLERELLDVQVSERANALRIDHRAGQHDDRVIALGMAAYVAMQLPATEPVAVQIVGVIRRDPQAIRRRRRLEEFVGDADYYNLRGDEPERR